MIAAVCLLTAGLLTRVVVLHGSSLALYQKAIGKLARLWDNPDSLTYRSQPAQILRLLNPDDTWVVEAAHGVLQDYGILSPDDAFRAESGNWRQRDDVRRLPTADREDLELWIMERVYRYCRALEERPDSPGDWERALKILDGASGPVRTPAFAPLRNRLVAKLEFAPSPALFVPAYSWLDEHLLGFVAECEEEPATADKPSPRESTGGLEALKSEALKKRQAAERALGHYAASLVLRPDSYWGHYRAAGMCYGLGQFREAAVHLEQCLQRRPGNPVLLGQLAGCLSALKQYRAALELCDQSLERAPDQAEFYRSRAFILAKLGSAGVVEDIREFESRKHTGALPGSPIFLGPFALSERAIEFWPTEFGGRDERTEIAPEEIAIRVQLADAVRDAGDYATAQSELDKILRRNPDDILTRMKSVEYAIKNRQFDAARRDLDTVLNHPRLLDHLRNTPTNVFTPFFMVTHRYLAAVRNDEAEQVARTASELAGQIGRDVAKAQYNLAQVLAVRGQKDTQFIKPAADCLARAFAVLPYLRQWYHEDRWWLHPVRTQLDAELRRIEGLGGVGGRMASASPVPR